jgi:hypothetical protein
MMFGFCAPRRETLPAQLNRILNQAYPGNLVFVDNFGETSGNIWDAWPVFKLRAETMRFDAVVFSVCQNDLDLFATHGASYGRYHLDNFLDGAPQWEAAVDLFRDCVAWRELTGIDVLVIFYSFTQTDRPIIDLLAPLLASLDLPFIDMLGYYEKETAVTVESYRVSEFDGHPSPIAHELAARRVAREFRAGEFLTRAPPLGKDIGVDLTDAVLSMIEQGMGVDSVLLWACEAAHAKLTTAQRRRAAHAAAPASIGVWEKLQDQSRAALSAWRRRERRCVRSVLLAKDGLLSEGYIANLDAYRRRLEAAVFVLVNGRSGQHLEAQVNLLPDSAYVQGGRAVAFDGDLGTSASDWRRKMDRMLSQVSLECPPKTSLTEGPQPLLPIKTLDPLARDAGVEGVIASEFHLIDRQIEMLEAYAASVGTKISPQAPEHRLVSAILVDLGSAFVYVDRLVAMLESKLPLHAPDGAPWTIVEVAIDGAVGTEVKDRTFDLVVELTYLEPSRGILRDRQLAGAVKDGGIYRFEFPLMMQGSVRVRLPENGVNLNLFAAGQARFSRVKVGNADWDMNFAEAGRIVQWVASDEPCTQVELSDIVLS